MYLFSLPSRIWSADSRFLTQRKRKEGSYHTTNTKLENRKKKCLKRLSSMNMGRNNGFKECPLEKGATKRGWPVGVMPWGMTTAEVGKGACISFSWPFFQFGIDT